MKKTKWGKFLLQLGLTAVLSAVILTIVGTIIGYIPAGNTFSSILVAIVSVGFFMWAMQINPGKEEFLTTLPQIILAIAIVDLLRNWITFIPQLTIPFTFGGLALGLGSVFLANMVTKKYIIK